LKKGSILYHENFKFKNGEIGEKLLVLLNTPELPSEPYLFCKATSKENGKPKSPGCHLSFSLFLIPGGKEFFNKDTWLQLYEIYPLDAASVLQDSLTKQLIEKGSLKTNTVKDLMSCISKIRDIETEYKRLILGKHALLESFLRDKRFKIRVK
jgi:hypothetical protein